MELQHVAEKLRSSLEVDPGYAPWEQYIKEGQELLQSQEQDYTRPPRANDRLYMGIGEGQVRQTCHSFRFFPLKFSEIQTTWLKIQIFLALDLVEISI